MRKSKHGEEEQGYLAERLVFVHGTKIINIPKNTISLYTDRKISSQHHQPIEPICPLANASTLPSCNGGFYILQ